MDAKAQSNNRKALASRKWLNRHFNADLDEIYAAAVGKQGWTEEDIVALQGYIDKWNRILETNLRLEPFKETIKVRTRDKPIEQTCIEDGVLYLNRVASNYMYCPDVFVAHEIGHMREQKIGNFRDSKEMKRFRNTYRNPGVADEQWVPKKVVIPPSGVASWHDRDVIQVLGDLDTHIGYNFRQISCDALCFQKRESAKIQLSNLVGQYLACLELSKKKLDGVIKRVLKKKGGSSIKEGLRSCIPSIARLSAGAWAVSLIARDVFHDGELAEHAERLVGINTVKRLESSSHGKETACSFEEIIQRNLTEKEILAFMVLTQAYMEHFVDCAEFAELSTKARMNLHLDKLTRGKANVDTRINEILFLGQKRDKRYTEAIASCLDDENIQVREVAIEALSSIGDVRSLSPLIRTAQSGYPHVRCNALFAIQEIVRVNPDNPESLRILMDLEELSNDPDQLVSSFAQAAREEIKSVNPSNPVVLDDLSKTIESILGEDTMAKMAALDAWSSVASSNRRGEEGLKGLQEVVSQFNDYQQFNRMMAIFNFRKVAVANPGNPEILKCIPLLVEHFDDPGGPVPESFEGVERLEPISRDAAIDSFGEIARVNPGNEIILKFVTYVVKHFTDQDYRVQLTALGAWEKIAEANPDHFLIIETKEAASQGISRQLQRIARLFQAQEDRLRNNAISDCSRFFKTHSGNRETLLFLPTITEHISDIKPEVQAEALTAWGKAVEAYPSEDGMLDDLLRVVEKFDSDYPFVQTKALGAWETAMKHHAEDDRVIMHLPKLVQYINDPNKNVSGAALKAWVTAAEAYPDHPIIVQTRTTCLQAIDKWNMAAKEKSGSSVQIELRKVDKE